MHACGMLSPLDSDTGAHATPAAMPMLAMYSCTVIGPTRRRSGSGVAVSFRVAGMCARTCARGFRKLRESREFPSQIPPADALLPICIAVGREAAHQGADLWLGLTSSGVRRRPLPCELLLRMASAVVESLKASRFRHPVGRGCSLLLTEVVCERR